MMKRLYVLLQSVFCTIILLAQTDVDTRIAVNEQRDPNTFVLIISNENYKYEQPVPFALNDGAIFKLYCEKTLGIPSDNIKYQPDASLNDMQTQFWLLEKKMSAFDGDARAIIYYSGHGMPSDDDKTAYLLPIDGNSAMPKSGLSVAELYQQLGAMKSRQTIVLLDACFSGARRDGQMLASSRGVAIKAKSEPVSGNMVVFSAAQGNETAYPYKEKKHGLFTYYILEQLQQNGGCVSLGDLSDYVTKQVSRISIVKNEKSQTPSVIASPSIENWRDWKFADSPAAQYETHAATRETAKATSSKTSKPAQIMLKRDIQWEEEEPDVSSETVQATSTHAVATIPKTGASLDLGYAEWTGKVVKGKPDGYGTMVFKKKHLIDSNDPDKNEAEAGDRIEGSYNNGHLEQGTWYKSNGDSELLLIGL